VVLGYDRDEHDRYRDQTHDHPSPHLYPRSSGWQSASSTMIPPGAAAVILAMHLL
jgi:hypothetical protein